MSSLPRRLFARLSDWVRLTRVELYRTFAQTVLGFLLGGGHDPAYLGVTLLILAPTIYGGLYALNDAHDYLSDRLHPTKRARPVAAGRVRPLTAVRIGLSLIAIGLSAALVFDLKVFALAVLFVVINLLYTFCFKTVPYVEIVLNSVTHPLRFVAGLWLAGSAEHGPVVVASFLATLAVISLKRHKEIRTVGTTLRPVLRHYTRGQPQRLALLCLLALAALWPWTTGWDQVLTGAWLVVTAAAMVVYLGLPRLQRLAAQPPHWLARLRLRQPGP